MAAKPNVNSIISISNSEVFNRFLHKSVDMIVRKTAVYDNFNNDIEWTKVDFETALQFITNTFRNAILDSNFKIEDQIADFDTDRQRCIVDCFEIRKNEIASSILTDNLSKYGPLMVDYDWKLKLVMGSAKFANFREPLLQLDIHCIERKEDKTTDSLVNLEMNETELKKLISVLESVK